MIICRIQKKSNLEKLTTLQFASFFLNGILVFFKISIQNSFLLDPKFPTIQLKKNAQNSNNNNSSSRKFQKKYSNNWTVVVDQLVKTTMGLLYFNTPVVRHFLGNPADGVPIHILFRKFRQVLHLKQYLAFKVLTIKNNGKY